MKNNSNKIQPDQIELGDLDGVIAAPEHHRVLFENEKIRIVEFKAKPGEVVPIHTHRWSSVSYVLSLSDFLSYDAEGNLTNDSRTGSGEIKQGGVFELPSFPPLHSVENIGNREIHAVSVELKD